MTIIKLKPNNDRGRIHFLGDEKISWKAKGILTYILHANKEVNVSIKHLKSLSKDGTDSIQSGLRELKKVGYISIETIQDDMGKFTNNIIYVATTRDV